MPGPFIDILNLTGWDLLLLGLLVAVTVGYTVLFVTRGKVVPLLFSTYMTYVLLQTAPFPALREFPFSLLAFAGIFLLILFLLARVLLQSPVGSETFGWFLSFVLALSQTGFLLAVILTFLPAEVISSLSAPLRFLFLGETAFFAWALAPVLLLLLVGRVVNQKLE